MAFRKSPFSVIITITYISTREDFLYLAAVEDLFSRMIVGWSMDETMTSRLVVDALSMAVSRRFVGSSSSLLSHSDRGSQYASEHYQRMLGEKGIKCRLACEAEQNVLCRRVREAWAAVESLRSNTVSQLDDLDRLDQSILAKAFRGEFVPQDPADEPAALLLERIRRECEAGTNGTAGAPKKRCTKSQ